jgi:Uma2 family endonuclease
MIAKITPAARLTAAEFDAFIADLSSDMIYEYIGGEMVEVPSNPYVSALAAAFSFFIKLFLREHHIEGHVTGEAGLYIILGERYAPDVAYISKARQPELARQGANPNPPELAIEIVSNEKSAKEIRELYLKVRSYKMAGVMTWVVYPDSRFAEVHRPGKAIEIVTEAQSLDDDTVLPGFSVILGDVFKNAAAE